MLDWIEGRLWIDPQEGRGHLCARCRCEMFGEEGICERCADRRVDAEDYE